MNVTEPDARLMLDAALRRNGGPWPGLEPDHEPHAQRTPRDAALTAAIGLTSAAIMLLAGWKLAELVSRAL